MLLKCRECPAWNWSEAVAYTDLGRRVPCNGYTLTRFPGETCYRSSMDLRREATRLRCIADALDKAAEMREAEERAVR